MGVIMVVHPALGIGSRQKFYRASRLYSMNQGIYSVSPSGGPLPSLQPANWYLARPSDIVTAYMYMTSLRPWKCSISTHNSMYGRGWPHYYFQCPKTVGLRLDLPEGIPYAIILPDDDLSLLLGAHMLHPHLLCQLGCEFTDEARIPEFRRDSEIFAASH